MAEKRASSIVIGIVGALVLVGIVIFIGSNLALRSGREDAEEPQATEQVREGEQQAPERAPGGGQEAAAGEDLVARGQELVTQLGCAGCHSLDGSAAVGPTFKGLYGRTEKLQGGQTVKVDEAYIKESILNPDAKVVEGYPAGLMSAALQAVRDRLEKEENLDAIIAYLKTLK